MISILDTPRLLQSKPTVIHTCTYTHTHTQKNNNISSLGEPDASRAYDVM